MIETWTNLEVTWKFKKSRILSTLDWRTPSRHCKKYSFMIKLFSSITIKCIGFERLNMTEMKFSYNKLWKLLIDKKMLKKDLIKQTGLNSSTIAKLSKDKQVSMEVLGKICKALECNVGDIVDYIRD